MLQKRDVSFEHVPKTICAKQMCSNCEAVVDLNVDCEQYRKLIYTFWQSRTFAQKIYVISHNSRGYEEQFLRRIFLN